jgi:RNA 2',3'-cyclic 3'-phosphodiesterase
LQKIRSFIAVDIPAGIKNELDAFSKELQKTGAEVSWVKLDRVHLTLKFLGYVLPEQIVEIKRVLAEAAVLTAPFRLQPAGCGAFPTIKQMRVVWVGLRGDEKPLRALHKILEAALAPLGFEPENRPVRAHLTVGRVKGKRQLHSLQEALLARQNFHTEAFDVTELVLYKSDLRPEGARYTPLFRAALACEE